VLRAPYALKRRYRNNLHPRILFAAIMTPHGLNSGRR
jgi:hypothetical protein